MDNQQSTAPEPDLTREPSLDGQHLQMYAPSELEIWADLGLLLGNAMSAVAYPTIAPDFRQRDR